MANWALWALRPEIRRMVRVPCEISGFRLPRERKFYPWIGRQPTSAVGRLKQIQGPRAAQAYSREGGVAVEGLQVYPSESAGRDPRRDPLGLSCSGITSNFGLYGLPPEVGCPADAMNSCQLRPIRGSGASKLKVSRSNCGELGRGLRRADEPPGRCST